MIKNFFKSLSIYGIFPVLSKSIAIFIVPIYARILSPEEYGISELFLSFVAFVNFLISMEIYSGVGRYYNENKSKDELMQLISTGLLTTLGIGLLLTLVIYTFKDTLFSFLLPKSMGDKYHSEFIMLIGLPFMLSIYDYLSVMMRYAGKPKIYLVISLTQLAFKILSTLYFLLILKMGLASIFYGLYIGTLITIIFIYYYNKDLIRIHFNFENFKQIMLFSLPIYPGLIIIGVSKPIINWIIGNKLSVDDLGFYSIASQVVSLFAILQAAFSMTFRPFVFENMNRIDFIPKMENILKLLVIPLFCILMLLIIFSYEIVLYFIGNKFINASSLIGFLSISFALNILADFVSFGPDIVKKTKYHTYNGMIYIISQVVLIYAFIQLFGFVGIGYGFLVSSAINFMSKYITTNKLLGINFSKEIILIILLYSVSANLIILNYFMIDLKVKIILMILSLIISFVYYFKFHNKEYNQLNLNKYFNN